MAIEPEQIKAEAETLLRDWQAVRDRLGELKRKPTIAGDPVERIRLAELDVIEESMATLEVRLAAFENRANAIVASPDNRLGRWLARRGWLFGMGGGVVVGLVQVLAITFLWNVKTIGFGFYGTVAAVIPVMLLAIATTNGRLLRWKQPDRTLGPYHVMAVAWIVTGEVASLSALANQHGTPVAFALAVNAMYLTGSLVVQVIVSDA